MSHFSHVVLSPQLIEQSKEKMPTLRAEVEVLRARVRDMGEAIFEDILLRRPKYVISVPLPLKPAAPWAAGGSVPRGAGWKWMAEPGAGTEEACVPTSALPWLQAPCSFPSPGPIFPSVSSTCLRASLRAHEFPVCQLAGLSRRQI